MKKTVFFTFVLFSLLLYTGCSNKTNTNINGYSGNQKSTNESAELVKKEDIPIATESKSDQQKSTEGTTDLIKKEDIPVVTEAKAEIPPKKIIVSLGDSGSKVLEIQKKLYSIGYDIKPDGNYGQATNSIINQVESKYGFAVSNSIDEDAYKKLMGIQNIRQYVEVNSSPLNNVDTTQRIQSQFQNSLFAYMSKEANQAIVNNAAARLNGGDLHNACVYFASEALRRNGLNVPLFMNRTSNFTNYLSAQGWKKSFDYKQLKPGDICFTTYDGGIPSHTYIFMGWVKQGDYSNAYIVDNQIYDYKSTYHIRNVSYATKEKDAFYYFMYK